MTRALQQSVADEWRLYAAAERVIVSRTKGCLSTLTDKCWYVQLDEAATARRDQRSFHVFAEGQHSDVRGQVFNLSDGEEVILPHDRWPKHLFIVLGIRGAADALVEGETFQFRAHSQLVVMPGTPCKIIGRGHGAVELLSLLLMYPRASG